MLLPMTIIPLQGFFIGFTQLTLSKYRRNCWLFVEIIMTSWKTSRKILHTVRTSTSTKVGLLVFIMGPFGRKPAIKLRTEWCLSSHPVWTCYSRMERKSDKEFLQMWLLCVHVSLSKCDWTCHMRSEVKSSTSGFQWQMGMNGSVRVLLFEYCSSCCCFYNYANQKASIRWQDSAPPISGYWPTSEPNAG